MSSEKIRVYDLAKEMNLQNKEVMTLLEKHLKLSVKAPASSISVDDANALKNALKTKPQAVKQEPPKKEVTNNNSQPEEKGKAYSSTVRHPQRPFNKPFDNNNRPARPEGQGGYQGQRPYNQDRPQRPEGQGGYQGQRRDFNSNRPPRPEGQGGYQGQRPYNQDRPARPEGQGGYQGQRPYNQDRPARPEGQGGYQGQRRDFNSSRPPRPEGQGGYQGQRPYNQDRPARPEGQGGYQGQRRDFNSSRPPRPEGQGGYQGQRPYNQDRKPFDSANSGENKGSLPSKQPIKRQFISQEAPGGPFGKHSATPNRHEKKKDTKQFGQSKEEKEEQARLLQQSQKQKKKAQDAPPKKVTEVIIDKPLTVSELADKTNVTLAEIVKNLMMQGILATVNQTIDVEVATKVVEAFEIVVLDSSYVDNSEQEKEDERFKVNLNSKHLKPRPPVVTIMGHVDHGKTTLLDAIRAQKHKIVSTEVGGITQSIGAYTAFINEKKIVFIDTPGHEAFTAMRARGSKVTDIVILVVAADDGIMPQTIEAINHAKAAGVPIIIAVNKIDKAGADPDRVLTQLTEHGLVPEEWGGDTICCKVSAIQATGLDELLEYILLVAEMQELKGDSTIGATGVVIEAKLDKGKGPLATLLVQNGTLRKGNCIIAGTVGGKIRALLSDDGSQIDKAGPSTPVEILGLSEVPQAGDRFEVLNNEKEMKAIVSNRKDQERETRLESIAPSQVKKDLIKAQQEETHELNIIIKANTHGSAEAVSASIQQLQSKQIFTKVVHNAVGDISEADVMLASASNAIIIGFSVKEDANAARIAAQEGVDIRKYDIIYEILEDIEKTMLGLLDPELKEIEIGKAEVRQIFTIGKTNKIAGCYVLEGKMVRNKTAAVERDGKQLYKGNMDMLKRFKEDAKEVNAGYECGISFNKFNDLKEGDIIIMFTTQEIERKVLV